jgi:hypothetical protein
MALDLTIHTTCTKAKQQQQQDGACRNQAEAEQQRKTQGQQTRQHGSDRRQNGQQAGAGQAYHKPRLLRT